MNRKLFQALSLSIFIVISFAFQQRSGAIITFSDKNRTWDFGTVYDTAIVEHDYLFKNTGKEPLIIQTVVSSCGAVTPSWSKEPILPGKTGVINVRYDARHRPGPFHKTVMVRSNARMPDSVSYGTLLYLKGLVIGKTDDSLR